MVKREDEQAFAELNGANPIFVEDAVRLLCEQLEGEPRIGDFRVVASHQESLHSHDAVSILTVGETFHQRATTRASSSRSTTPGEAALRSRGAADASQRAIPRNALI